MTAIEKYLFTLRRRAHSDWVSARLLWNLGLYAQAIWLIQQSTEKHLKFLWAQNKTFSSVEGLKKALRNLSKGEFDPSHDLTVILKKLDSCVKDKLDSSHILQVKSEALRYGGSYIYGGKIFNSAEVFIKKIRKLLGEVVKGSLYDEIRSAAVSANTQALRRKQDSIFKDILSLKNRISRKRRHKQIKRAILKSF